MKHVFISFFVLCSFAVLGQDGSYDTSFGTNGTTVTDLPGEIEQNLLVAENTDGTLWTHAIATSVGSFDKVLVRYTAGGIFDTSFGVNGVVQIPVDGDYNALDALPDGSMLIAGKFNENFVVLKYLSNGTLDTSFGNDGIATIDFANEIALSLFPEEDGNITVVGRFRNNNEEGIFVASLLPNGMLNPNYGANGIAVSILTNDNILFTYQVSRYTDGSFLVPFSTEDSNKHRVVKFAKILQHGTLDPTFGNNGVSLTQISSQSLIIVSGIILDNEKILALIHIQGMNPPATSESYFIQLQSNGSLDVNYGNNGLRDFPNNLFFPTKVIKQENNRLLFEGSEYSIDGGFYTIMRTFMSGFVDESFASQGRFFEADFNFGEAIITADGGIVSCGSTPFFIGPEKLVILKLLNSPLSVAENSEKFITISPNPTNDVIAISCAADSLINEPYQITDATGKIIRAGVFDLANPTLSFENFSAGLYLLNIHNTTVKIIKE